VNGDRVGLCSGSICSLPPFDPILTSSLSMPLDGLRDRTAGLSDLVVGTGSDATLDVRFDDVDVVCDAEPPGLRCPFVRGAAALTVIVTPHRSEAPLRVSVELRDVACEAAHPACGLLGAGAGAAEVVVVVRDRVVSRRWRSS
jgi:hypothetical protein